MTTSPARSPALAAASAAIAFNLSMLVIHAFKLPLLRYNPATRVWDLSSQGGPLPMLFYGQLLWAGLAAAVVGGLVFVLVRQPPRPRTWLYVGGWLLLSSTVALSYYIHANWP